MIPFIDLAAIKPTPGTTPASGIDLSLTNLVNFKKPEVSPTVTQNQLKTQPEVTSPDFNVGEYLVKMQENFNKMLEANQPILSATVSTQQALEKAQEKSASSINSTTNYISGKLEKLEKVTATSKEEVKQIINGKQETPDQKTDSTGTVNKALTQETEVTPSTDFMGDMANIIEKFVLPNADAFSTEPVPTPAVSTTQLVNNQETTVDKTAQSVSNLSNTVSNFATNMVNGISSENRVPNSPLVLAEPKRDLLSITKESAKPDLSGQTLSALRQMAENTQILTNLIYLNLKKIDDVLLFIFLLTNHKFYD